MGGGSPDVWGFGGGNIEHAVTWRQHLGGIDDLRSMASGPTSRHAMVGEVRKDAA